jgi:hypothetical protein
MFVALASALALFGGTAFAQVSVVPEQPKAQQTVRVQLPDGALGKDANGLPASYSPKDTRVSMAGNRITVSILVLPNSGFELQPSPPLDLPLGQFPGGSYEVEVLKRTATNPTAGSLGSATFAVTPRAATDPLWDNSDAWWNPAESGWGLYIQQRSTGSVFASWFVYGPDNKPVWYLLSGGAWTSPSEYRGPVYRTTGPWFGGAFDPALVTVTLVGSAILGFDPFHYDRATAVVTVDGVTIVKQIRRFDF